MSLMVVRCERTPSWVQAEILNKHPELASGKNLSLRLNCQADGPFWLGTWMPGDVPEGVEVLLGGNEFAGTLSGGQGYRVRVWAKKEAGK